MSAYKPGFIHSLIPDQNSLSVIGSITTNTTVIGGDSVITPSGRIDDYELLMAEDEAIITMQGDAVVGLSSTTALQLLLSLGTAVVAPDGSIVVVPNVPAGTDPLWAYVTLLADFDIPTGAGVYNYLPRPTESGAWPSFPTQDSKLSQCWITDAIKGSSLYPLFGKNTVGSLAVEFAAIGWPGTGLLDDNNINSFTGRTRNQRIFDSDFTVEGWDLLTSSAYLSSEGLGIYLGQVKGGVQLPSIVARLPRTGVQGYLGETSGGIETANLTSNVQYFTHNQAVDVWVHICLERRNGVIALYVNGIRKASIATLNKFFAASHLGHFHGPRRITQDIARYTGEFTPPAAPFPLGVPGPSSTRAYVP